MTNNKTATGTVQNGSSGEDGMIYDLYAGESHHQGPSTS